MSEETQIPVTLIHGQTYFYGSIRFNRDAPVLVNQATANYLAKKRVTKTITDGGNVSALTFPVFRVGEADDASADATPTVEKAGGRQRPSRAAK